MKFMKPLAATCLSAIYIFCSIGSSFADDTEIFFTATGGAPNERPNILFVVDTSGSMRSTPSTGGSDSKLAVVQSALTSMLDSISNVNVGLARFSVPGGPILYPVLPIDTPVEPEANSVISSRNNDVEEYINRSDPGNVLTGGTRLDLNNENIVGLRFDDLLIPQGAAVTSAVITFTASRDGGNLTDSYEIVAERSDDAAEYTGIDNDVTTRTYPIPGLPPRVIWAPGEEWDKDESYESADITALVQDTVDRTGWCGGNAMTFKIAFTGVGSSDRGAYSYDSTGTDDNGDNISLSYLAPALKVTYDSTLPAGANGCFAQTLNKQISDGDDDFELESDGDFDDDDWFMRVRNRNLVGLRFRDIPIPQGATIKSAVIRGYTNINTDNSTNVSIAAVAADTAPANGRDFFRSTLTSGTNWTIGRTRNIAAFETTDISSEIEDIVNRGGWASGNDIGIVLTTSSGENGIVSRTYASYAPILSVQYEGRFESGSFTVRDILKSEVAEFSATGSTPISDTMLEAGLYYRGESVLYGAKRGSPAKSLNRVSHPDTYTGGSLIRPSGCTDSNLESSSCEDETINNGTYISPITGVCQSNHIVFLTDGAPTYHDSRTSTTFKNWSGSNCLGDNGQGTGAGCSRSIAGFLSNEKNDQSSLFAGNQTVTTHTIGFDFDTQFLADVAAAGGGQYLTASDQSGLVTAFNSVVASILDVNTTFVTSGLSVNQFNRLTHNDELYYSLFQPQAGPQWQGNVKRYRLNGGKVVDFEGKPAINASTGEFEITAKSWWSTNRDGNNVVSGGIAEQQTVGRTLYTNVNKGAAITDASNTISLSNSNITEAIVGAVDATDRDETIEWALGFDVSDLSRSTPHQVIGDPLHSRPTLLTYNATSETVVYVGTNNGYLHVFDSITGREKWSFIPEQLLGNLKSLKDNVSSDSHPYGMDGEITIYVDDQNDNNAVDSGEKVYLFIGMRRGGSSYFVFDISNPNAPSLMYELDAATLTDIGQSWSRPIITKMNIGGVSNRLVAIIGAGYDTVQDSPNMTPQTASVGNNIYIVDVLTGSLIWSVDNATQAANAGPLNTLDSVPNTVKAFDLTDDGLVDHFYASDTKGQIFRFDVDNVNQTISGGRLASLGSNTVADNRKFFNSPDVALIRDSVTNQVYISIAIGSGFRASPLDTATTEHFYVLRDEGVLQGLFNKEITIDDLADLTTNVGDSDDDGVSDAAELINTKGLSGWYIDLPETGEKVLADALTFNGSVLFTTYIPASGGATSCEPAAGSSRIYAMSIEDAQPYVETDYVDGLTENDRFITLPGAGIAPEPQVILTDEGGGVKSNLCVGRNCGLEELLKQPPKRLMPIKWRHVIN